MSEPRPDDDLTASETTPPAEGDASAGTTESTSDIGLANEARGATPPSDPETSSGVSPAMDVEPRPLAAWTPPPTPPVPDWSAPTSATPPAPDWSAPPPPTPAPPASDWAAHAATSPTPPGGTPVQPVPDTMAWAPATAQAWTQGPAPAYQPPPANPPQQGWPQPPGSQQTQASAPPPGYPPQQAYAQQPGYPPPQPAPAGWVQPQGAYWDQQGGSGVYQYQSSVLAVVAGIQLLLGGLLLTLAGVGLLLAGQLTTSTLTDNGVSPSVADTFKEVFVIIAAVIIVFGILMMLSAIGIWLHKSWGRVLGLLFSVFGVLAGLGGLSGRSGTATLADGQIVTTNVASFGIAFLVFWGACLLFLIVAGGHFNKRRIA